ncbi:MAG: hypothetical protein JNL74_05125, partial [Fibrobacteres bacterium]|nr:hypothetical protein [Fibrobacterota bacterium]
KADIAFVPALWCREDAGEGIKLDKDAEVKLVNSVVTTRAIENQMHVAFINGAGQFTVNGKTGHLIGRTQLSSPFLGSVGRVNSNSESVLYTTADMSILPVAESAYRIREDLAI